MSITTGVTGTHLHRANLWSSELKEALRDELNGQGYVRWLTDFPEGDQLNIPSIGDATVRDYVENDPAVYDSLDTGNFQFGITEYKQSGLYITEKARQDSYYASQLEASFVPKQNRALAENIETDIFGLAAPAGDAQNKAYNGVGQTGNDANTINGAAHRFAAGLDGTTGLIEVADFAKALNSLKRANVPDTNLIAIVDPSVEYVFNTLSSFTNFTNTPRWEGLVAEGGISSGMRFTKNIYGFDVYVSNYLPSSTGEFTVPNGVSNIFFSAASPDIVPFIGAWRQMPKVDSEYNKDFQREEYITTARYGLSLYRPENLVTIISDTNQITYS